MTRRRRRDLRALRLGVSSVSTNRHQPICVSLWCHVGKQIKGVEPALQFIIESASAFHAFPDRDNKP
jgi:hypothetical protein